MPISRIFWSHPPDSTRVQRKSGNCFFIHCRIPRAVNCRSGALESHRTREPPPTLLLRAQRRQQVQSQLRTLLRSRRRPGRSWAPSPRGGRSADRNGGRLRKSRFQEGIREEQAPAPATAPNRGGRSHNAAPGGSRRQGRCRVHIPTRSLQQRAPRRYSSRRSPLLRAGHAFPFL
jgi:hypothetical protein